MAHAFVRVERNYIYIYILYVYIYIYSIYKFQQYLKVPKVPIMHGFAVGEGKDPINLTQDAKLVHNMLSVVFSRGRRVYSFNNDSAAGDKKNNYLTCMCSYYVEGIALQHRGGVSLRENLR